MSHVFTDARMAWRATVSRPGFTSALIAAIALGIGINTAIFSAVDAILMRPLPFPEADRLVTVWGFKSQIGREEASVPDYLDWKAQSSSVAQMTAFSNSRETLARPGNEPERIAGARVMPDFFTTLGARVALGRDFGVDDFVFGSHHVVVLSDELWRDRFGADRSVIGTTVSINGASFTVIGVAQPALSAPPGARLWTPLALDPAQRNPGRRNDFLTVIGRLRPSADVAGSQRDLAAIAKRLESAYPESNTGWTTVVEPLQETLVGGARRALLVFMAVVAIVLLVTCANIANLLLARAVAREREMSVRSMLGADRARLFSQLVLESVLVAIAGGAAGMGVAVWGVELLKQFAPAGTPRLDEVSLDGRAVFFALTLSLGTGLLFGVAPAWRLSRASNGGGAGVGSTRSVAGGRGASRARAILVATQIAMAVLLLVGGGLLVRSFREMQRVATGFDGTRVLTFVLPLPREKYRDVARAGALYDQIGDRLRALPGVEAVGLTSDLPLSGGGNYASFEVEGRPRAANDVVQDATLIVSDHDYFRTMGIRLREGRGIEATDRENTPMVAVVNKAFVQKYFAREPVIGKRITFDGTTYHVIVGVSVDVRLESLASDAYPAAYVPLAQVPQRGMSVAMRTSGDPALILATVRREMKAIEPDVPVYDAATMDQRLSKALSAPRAASSLVGGFAVLAMVLALAGLYGVIAYSVAQRTRELGVRMALGATRRDVISLVLRQGMTPALAGVGGGLILAFALTRTLGALLYGVAPHDAATFAFASIALLVLAALACAVPARAAARLNPVTALRLD
jgi:predicted permease